MKIPTVIFFTILSMILTLPTRIFAEEMSKENTIEAQSDTQSIISFDYIKDEVNNTITLTNYTGTATNVIIPSELDNYSITRIEKKCFAENQNIKYVYIPKSVNTMGERVFYKCNNLKCVRIDAKIDEIPNGTFEHCVNLTDINIPYTVKYLGYYAFYDCSSLEYLYVPSSVSVIGSYPTPLYHSFIDVPKLTIYCEKNSYIDKFCTDNPVSLGNAVVKLNCQYVTNIKGDINNDGIINILDVIQLKRYLLDKNVFAINTDVNEDTNVDWIDVMLLNKKILNNFDEKKVQLY